MIESGDQLKERWCFANSQNLWVPFLPKRRVQLCKGQTGTLSPPASLEMKWMCSSCCRNEWHFEENKHYNRMFSRHCVRVQIRSGGKSLTFTTSLTGWAFWTLKSGERTAKSTRSASARESALLSQCWEPRAGLSAPGWSFSGGLRVRSHAPSPGSQE